MFEQASPEALEARCATDREFRLAYHQHRKLSRQIDADESKEHALSDEHLSELKRERARLKAELARRWPEAA
jgi:uncharacterized protein YdcH (DUF465 family)